MKIEDLMIGDWVRLKDDSLSYEESCMKITFLSNSTICSLKCTRTNAQIGLIKPNEDWLCPVFDDDIEPIPLTPEILEKSGFNDSIIEAQKRIRFVILCKKHQITYSFNSNWFSIYKNANVSGSDYPIFICAFQERINYVHELQHALKLCGIDKEIVV